VVRELPIPCWVLLKRSDGQGSAANIAAAIAALKTPVDDVAAAGAHAHVCIELLRVLAAAKQGKWSG
jgi:hypothetical protein